jgi:ribose-phosphate pyrophosphokinase
MIDFKVNGNSTEFKNWKFPAGEVGIQLPTDLGIASNVDIVLTMPTSDDIFACLNILDALKRLGVPRQKINLHIPYLPYGRQDRVCNGGESFALQVFASVISSRPYFNTLYTKDVHSNVSLDVFDQISFDVVNIPQTECAKYLPKFDALIAPDKGAAGKVRLHHQVQSLDTTYHVLNKVRLDGRIIYEDYHYDTIRGNVCVVDDICDAGGTFLALGTMLKRSQPNITSLNLYVTHGFMGKGLDELNKFYDTIYVHNLMNDSIKDKVKEI